MYFKQEFLRFLLVGALNTAFGYLVFYALIFLGLHYSVALLLSMILGVIFNFFTYGKLVFYKSNSFSFLRFVTLYLFLYVVGTTLIQQLMIAGINLNYASFLSLTFVAVFSFLGNKYLVFTVEKEAD